MKHGIVAAKGKRFSAPKGDRRRDGPRMDGLSGRPGQGEARPLRLRGSRHGRLFTKIASPQVRTRGAPAKLCALCVPVVTPFLWKFSVPPYLRESPYRL